MILGELLPLKIIWPGDTSVTILSSFSAAITNDSDFCYLTVYNVSILSISSDFIDLKRYLYFSFWSDVRFSKD